PDDCRSPVEALRQRANRAVRGRDELDPKRERVRGRRVRDRDGDPTTVGRPRRAAFGRRCRDERPGSARPDPPHRHVAPHPTAPPPLTSVSRSAPPEPSSATRHTSRFPDRLEANASQRPSGDQAGALAGVSTRRAGCWPAPPTAYTYTDVRHSLGSASMSGTDT